MIMACDNPSSLRTSCYEVAYFNSGFTVDKTAGDLYFHLKNQKSSVSTIKGEIFRSLNTEIDDSD